MGVQISPLAVIQFAEPLLTDPYGVAEPIPSLLNETNVCQLCYRHTSAPVCVDVGSDLQVHPWINVNMEY